MRLSILSTFLVVPVLFISSCKNNTVSVQGQLSGDLQGQISLYDSESHSVQDKSGIVVSADGTPFSATTDTAGYWTIKNLPVGIYSMSFSKAGYNTMKNTSFQFVGGGSLWYGKMTLGQTPNYTVSMDSLLPPNHLSTMKVDSVRLIPRYDTIRISGRDSIMFAGYDTTHHLVYVTYTEPGGSIYGHFSSAPTDINQRNCRIIGGRTPNLDITDPSTYVTYADVQLGAYHQTVPTSSFILNIQNQLYLEGFAAGETIYLKAYPESWTAIMSYFDIKTHKSVTIGWGTASKVVQFVK